MSGPGSGGNVIAALCSFLIPGLGQLLQGRLLTAAIHFFLGILLWFLWLGILMHIWSAYSAAVYVPRV
jgi:TM2 domain-containing membrane protein YozV